MTSTPNEEAANAVPGDTVGPAVSRLSNELARIAQSIADLRTSWREQPGAIDRHSQCVELAKMIYHHRRLRGDMNPMFETREPNWHMALTLLIADAAGTPIGLDRLSRAARLSPGATRRRLLGLIEIGVVQRTPGTSRSGKATYGLTADGERRVVSYLSSIVALLS